MSSINKVIMTGNLTRDPECNYSGQDANRASFGIALNRKYNKDGQTQEETTFVDCTAWGKTAQVIAQYVRKGSKIGVIGRLFLNRWTDTQTQQQRQKLMVTVEGVELLDGPPQNAPGHHGHYNKGAAAQQPQTPPEQQPQQQQYLGEGDVPF